MSFEMMDSLEEQTVASSSKNIFTIVICCIAIGLIILVGVFLLINVQYRSTTSMKLISQRSNEILTTTTTTTTLSPEEAKRLSSFQDFLNHSSIRPNPDLSRSSSTMNQFMRSIYRQIYDETGARRRKRSSSLSLSTEMDSIVSLPNRYHHRKSLTLPASATGYHFEFDSSLEHLVRGELVLPIDNQVTKLLTINLYRIVSSSFVLIHQQSLPTNSHWLKINLTKHITSLPFSFFITLTNDKQQILPISPATGFLTLYFRRSSRLTRRDLSIYDNQNINYPDDPNYCQVRPLRTSFAELNWTSWVIEPSSYEMNVCSGSCHTASNMRAYGIMQNLLNQIHPQHVPPPCCRPKRFSWTVLLYYDGPNLILKRHDDMRVVECGCA